MSEEGLHSAVFDAAGSSTDTLRDDWEVRNLGRGTNGGFQVLVTHIPTGVWCQLADAVSLEAAREEGIKHITEVFEQQ
jgi:hypothetical protein